LEDLKPKLNQYDVEFVN